MAATAAVRAGLAFAGVAVLAFGRGVHFTADHLLGYALALGCALTWSLYSVLSRRFGEGVVNGALTARVGVAAMELCRPLPFVALERPAVSSLVSRALTGLVSRADR